MKTQTITIIGLDRIGASIGLAIKKSPLDVTIIGHDPNEEKGQAALNAVQAIDKFEGNLVYAARKADILVITAQIADIQSILQVIGTEVQPHTLVIDLSSLKRLGLDWAKRHLQQGHYVGAVPVLAADYLADGRSQTSSASADLFQNSAFCLMPSPKADPQAVETAVNFGIVLGALPYFVDPDEYDGLMQGTETLPALVSLAMFSALQQSIGWRDMLRFAGQPFALSTLSLEQDRDIAHHALQNKQATLRWLDALMAELKAVRRLVHDEEAEILAALAEQMGIERDKWLDSRQKNDWDERQSPPIERRSMADHLLGGLARRGGRKDA
ncbi:prephenate dehydrogenase [Candidatus Leptofilum sp.]|uniref:prephenate dehydrogenase n=1 Tax=Candidatus Leptofilum sp. TaxID=3241576 RepID=UPI003B5CD26A